MGETLYRIQECMTQINIGPDYEVEGDCADDCPGNGGDPIGGGGGCYVEDEQATLNERLGAAVRDTFAPCNYTPAELRNMSAKCLEADIGLCALVLAIAEAREAEIAAESEASRGRGYLVEDEQIGRGVGRPARRERHAAAQM